VVCEGLSLIVIKPVRIAADDRARQRDAERASGEG
jgi:hypothetical protein